MLIVVVVGDREEGDRQAENTVEELHGNAPAEGRHDDQRPDIVIESLNKLFGPAFFKVISSCIIRLKIRIADYYGNSVPGAEARVYVTPTEQDLWTEAVAILPEVPDSGNLMSYDAGTDQYVFHWNVSWMDAGSYMSACPGRRHRLRFRPLGTRQDPKRKGIPFGA